MAITKIHPIKSTLKKAIDYIVDPAKTDDKLLVSSFGCAVETADLEFEKTRLLAMQKGNNLAHQLIQAFEPGEVSYAQAHEIGRQLADEILGGKYEYVIATHINKEHCHNHMKRAAVQWGIGRVLYDLNTVWVEIEKRGRSFVIKDSERVKLDNAYLSALKRLGLTPAAACGIQSLLTPKTLPGQTAPEENAPAANPQPKQGNSQPTPASAPQRADRPTTRSDSQQTPSAQQCRATDSRTVPFTPPQSAARQRTDCYVVLSTKVQGGMSGSSTLVTLRAPDGKQIPAFARGARPELSAGTVLSNVKITMRQQDTVAFYVLESYEIVPQEDRAA